MSSWTSDPTPGKDSASSTHARSTTSEAASRKIPLHASTNLPQAASAVTIASAASSSDASSVFPSCHVDLMARHMISRAIFCAASHRLNGSESCASWNSSSSAVSAGVTASFTGALNPRRTLGTGSDSTPAKVNVADMSFKRRTTEPASPGTGTQVDVDPAEVTETLPETSRSFPVFASTKPDLHRDELRHLGLVPAGVGGLG